MSKFSQKSAAPHNAESFKILFDITINWKVGKWILLDISLSKRLAVKCFYLCIAKLLGIYFFHLTCKNFLNFFFFFLIMKVKKNEKINKYIGQEDAKTVKVLLLLLLLQSFIKEGSRNVSKYAWLYYLIHYCQIWH